MLQNREIDFHMELGDVIVNCILGPTSPAARDLWTTEECDFKPVALKVNPSDSEDAQWFYDLLINDLAVQPSPAIRQVSKLFITSIFRSFQITEMAQEKTRLMLLKYLKKLRYLTNA